MKKYSKQRELILTSLQNRTDHPTAETLYMDLKKSLPKLGIATVYRNLVELCEDGQIKKINLKNGPDRFDGNLIQHVHFVCNKCGCVQDLFLSEQDEQNIEDQIELLIKSINAEKLSTQILIAGICNECH